MKAIVNTAVLPMFSAPGWENTVEDEVLYGMVVDILEAVAPGWYRIRTHYRYEGIVDAANLILDQAQVAWWESLPKKVIFHKNSCDILSIPKVQGWHMEQLLRGCLVAPVGDAENGWQRVQLPDGRMGYAPAGILADQHTAPMYTDENQLRQALVDAAMGYAGAPYRWGGKTPMGIDCSGLCSMAYMFCGILIYRDAKIVEGFPLHEITLEEIKLGDLLFFPGHVAMYIGDGRYCHATAKAGVNGFVINSLNPGDPDYREDLRKTITHVASYF